MRSRDFKGLSCLLMIFFCALAEPSAAKPRALPRGAVSITSHNQEKFQSVSPRLTCYAKSAQAGKAVPGKVFVAKARSKRIRYFLPLSLIFDARLMARQPLSRAASRKLKRKLAAQLKAAKSLCNQLPSGDVFVIAASAGPNGIINPSGSVSVRKGADQAFSIAADPGFGIFDVLVDGVSDAAAVDSGSYTFQNIAANHTIAASFRPAESGLTILEHFLSLDRVDTASLDNASWDGVTTMRPTRIEPGHPGVEAQTVLQLNFENADSLGQDDSNYGVDMTCSLCPVWNQSGRIGAVASFAGKQGLVTGIEHTRYGFADKDFTWAMWFRTAATGHLTLIGTYCGYGHKGLNLMIKQGQVSLYVKPSGASAQTLLSNSTGLNDGTWHHVAAVRNAQSGELAIYLDGQLDASVQGPILGGDLNCNRLALGTGSISQPGSSDFKGDLDAVALLDRAFTPEEITALARGTKVTGSFRSDLFLFAEPVFSLSAAATESAPEQSRVEVSFDGTHWCPARGAIADPACPFPTRRMQYRVSFLDDTVLDAIQFDLDTTPRCVDYDHDGYGNSPAGSAACQTSEPDCNDTNSSIFPNNANPFCGCGAGSAPAAQEVCGDGYDNDCNGASDDEDYQCYQHGTIYYISSAFGRDSNSGLTPGEAWQTVAMAQSILNSGISPGDKILFRRGDIWTEGRLSIGAQGTPEQPITIGTYAAGRRPLFDISETGWILGFRNGASNVLVRGLHLTRPDKTLSVSGVSFPPGATTDYIRLDDVHLQGLAYGIVYSSQHFILENSIIEDNENSLSGGGHSQGFYTAGTQGGIVRNNEFHRNGKRVMFDHNIYLSEASNQWLIEGNLFTGSGGTSIVAHGDIDGVVIKGNTFRDNDTAVIDISDYSSDHIMHLDNFVVEGNVIYDNPWVFWLLGPKNLIVRNNLIFSNGPGNPVFTGGDAALRNIEGMQIVNNTFYNNSEVILGLNTDGDITFANNIVNQSDSVSGCVRVPNAVSSLFNNLYYFPGQPEAAYLTYGGSSYTLAGAQGIGLEGSSLRGDPLFANAAQNDFHLTAASPARDRGAPLPVITDFDGHARPWGSAHDIGAFEWGN